MERLDRPSLVSLLQSLEKVLTKTKELLSVKDTANSLDDENDFNHDFQYLPQILDNGLVSRVMSDVKGLSYTPQGTNKPGIHLFGDVKYPYSAISAKVSPTPMSPVMSELLGAVNTKLDANYNSILINRYPGLKCTMSPHQDDEAVLDPSSSIATLSLGAKRRFHISRPDDKDTPIETVILENNSLFEMRPGFQQKYYHAVPVGRKAANLNERGLRFSITFRRINGPPSTNTSVIKSPTPQISEETSTPQEKFTPKTKNIASPNTVIFGSSLVKHLDEDLLSEYEKKFKVYSHPGAHVRTIRNDIIKVSEKNQLNCKDIKTVFLLCGGNDLEDLVIDTDISFIYEDLSKLFECAKEVFPNAHINVISMLPRRDRYNTHIRNMHKMNIWLEKNCPKFNIRYVHIFSFYVNKKSGDLYNDLFKPDLLHLNNRGCSVLGKVLIGVANRPRN